MNSLCLMPAAAFVVLALVPTEAWANSDRMNTAQKAQETLSTEGQTPVEQAVAPHRGGTLANELAKSDLQIREGRLLAEFDERVRSYVARRPYIEDPSDATERNLAEVEPEEEALSEELCSLPDISRERDVVTRKRDVVSHRVEPQPEELCSLPDISTHSENVSTRDDISIPRHGSIFTRDIEEVFRGLIAQVFSPFDQARAVRTMPLFPAGAPVQFLSPQLLRALPTLPEGLEYRFQQHDLVIFDLHADRIVDSIWIVIGPSRT